MSGVAVTGGSPEKRSPSGCALSTATQLMPAWRTLLPVWIELHYQLAEVCDGALVDP
jgi:hypothetical protein